MTQGMSTSGHGDVVAAIFRGADQGQSALEDLKAAGFTHVEISQVSGEDHAFDDDALSNEVSPNDGQRAASGAQSSLAAPSVAAFFQEHDSKASSFEAELVKLGFSKRDSRDLVDGLTEGAALVTADAGCSLAQVVSIFTKYYGDVRYTRGGPFSGTAGAGSEVERTLTEEDIEIQLRAERLVVDKRRVQHGEARVRKEIVVEIKTIEVPVSHEELVIERHAVGVDGSADIDPIAAETIRIPLTEEKVTVSKETIVREQVDIGTRRVQTVEHVTDTVKHEELRVDNSAFDDKRS